VLFQLRGRTKEQIISDLRHLRGEKLAVDTTASPENQPTINHHQYQIKIDNLWQYNEPLDSSLVVITPSSNETLLDVLGAIPLGQNEESAANLTVSDVVMKYLQTLYQEVSQKAMLAAMNVGES
jgi:uncharacterized Zn finger protein